MGTAAQIVAKAASQIGTKESPSGSNRVKYWTQSTKWKGYNGQPWCDRFVSWCGEETGSSSVVGDYVYCPYHVTFFKNKGQWLGRTSSPQPGDIVFFAGSNGVASHVGIVEKKISSTCVQTIEGNTSTTSQDNGGCVMRRTRYYNTVGSSFYILGFGRPAYSGSSATSTTTTTTTTTATTVKSVNGTVKNVQQWLNANYKTNLAVDNSYGPKTKKALVKALQTELNKQTKAKLTVDGVFGAKTKAACVNIKSGSKGNITRTLQGGLICNGYAIGEFDGICGAKTVAAIKKFQKAKGLTQDGVAGKNTFAKLFG